MTLLGSVTSPIGCGVSHAAAAIGRFREVYCVSVLIVKVGLGLIIIML